MMMRRGLQSSHQKRRLLVGQSYHHRHLVPFGLRLVGNGGSMTQQQRQQQQAFCYFSTSSNSSTKKEEPKKKKSSNSSSSLNYRFIPEPTWSIQDLQFTTTNSSNDVVSKNELQLLSRRALLQFTNQQLECSTIPKDLTNMLHMINQLQEFQQKQQEKQQKKEMKEQEQLSEVDIYDIVRGVISAPLRSDPMTMTTTTTTTTTTDNPNNNNDHNHDTDHLDHRKQKEKEETQIWNQLLRPKMIRKGGRHEYFSIITGYDTTTTTTK